MLNIYSYVNSKAIREHLKKIEYKFNAKETAWLIFQCNSISLTDKHDAWKQLIDEMSDNSPISLDCNDGIIDKSGMSDVVLDERFNYLPGRSLKELIKSQVKYDEKLIDIFNREDDGAIYQYRFYCKGDHCWCEDFEGIYSSLNACWSEIEDDFDLDIEVIDIRKKYINSDSVVEARFLPDKSLISIYSTCLGEDELERPEAGFDEFWFEFPVPFAKGDILVPVKSSGPVNLWSESGPLVMDSITPFEKELNNRMQNSIHGDSSDMLVWGYFQDPDGRIYHECEFNYMDYDYYEGPFDGPRRLLVALSNFMKGEITIEVLLSAYRKIIMDEMCDDIMLHSWYSEDTLRLCGLNDVINTNNHHLVKSGLNPNISFYRRNLFIHDEYKWDKNAELCEKCHRIASNYYQPKKMLFIYGDHGCGKTTILQCLGNMAKQLSRPNLLYVTAENFVNEVIYAIRSDHIEMLRSRYRTLDFLIVDDIQKLCDRASSVEEFINTVNDLLTKGAQIVISSDRPLEKLHFPEELITKLSSATMMKMVSENSI